MAESRYEKYIIRKPAIFGEGGQLVIPDKVPVKKPDTGPIIMWSPKLKDDTDTVIEYGIISGDITVGNKPGVFGAHKTYADGEYFLFLSTNPDDPNDLGAEAEFWLGEDDELEKVVIDTPSCVYVPSGVGHFPITWKNVRRPVVFVVVVASGFTGSVTEPASMKGRPT